MDRWVSASCSSGGCKRARGMCATSTAMSAEALFKSTARGTLRLRTTQHTCQLANVIVAVCTSTMAAP